MKYAFPLLLMTLISTQVFAQNEEKPVGFQKENLFFGGNFGFSLGSNMTFLNLSPQVGYRFSNSFAAGAGVNGIYSSYNRFGYKERNGVAGLNIFGRVYPIDNIFIQLQPEMNYVWGKFVYDDARVDQKLNGQVVPSLIGGVGAVIPTGGRGGMMLMLQYDILQNGRSPYSNRPFFNIGYIAGL